MKILVFGKNGQVGWELQRSLSTLGEVIALDRNSTVHCGDLTKLNELALTLQTIKPDVVVNAAAYTAVDKAESDICLAQLINNNAVEVLAKESAKLDALFVHFSTDYVFDGEGDHYRNEDEKSRPLNVYGVTKRAGEVAIIKNNPKHLIFRTSWVYAIKGNNFPKTITKLAKSKETLSIINDQFGAPTSAELIADCTAIAIRKALKSNDHYGLYHLVANGETNWYGYAQYIRELLVKMNIQIAVKEILPVPSSAYLTAAKRPMNSRLSSQKLSSIFDINIPDWKIGVERFMTELEEIK